MLLRSILWTNIASNALPKTSAKTIQPIAIGLTFQSPMAMLGVPLLLVRI